MFVSAVCFKRKLLNVCQLSMLLVIERNIIFLIVYDKNKKKSTIKGGAGAVGGGGGVKKVLKSICSTKVSHNEVFSAII